MGNLRAHEINLSDNLIEGALPPELGNGASGVQRLDLSDNQLLAGPLPMSLTALSLRTLRYQNTGLCVPAGGAMRDWIDSIPNHVGTRDCEPPFGDHGSWTDADWEFVNAAVSTVEGQMLLKTTQLGYPAYAVRGHALADWDVRAKMGGASPAGRPWMMLFTGDYRYPVYSLRLGSGPGRWERLRQLSLRAMGRPEAYLGDWQCAVRDVVGGRRYRDHRDRGITQ